ncbi:MAG: LysR substrate-binding domain-containing protein [Bacteroidales bacterium]
MIDFRLKVFQSVAYNLSFTKASKELYISQPAISKHIQELEQEYKVQLFERMGNKITLTHAGELFLNHAESILSGYRQLDFEMNILQENYVGELRLGASTTIAQYVLPPVLATFIKKFPNIKVSLVNGNTRDIERALIEHRIDLGMVEGSSRLVNLRYIPFIKDELVVVTSTKSSLAGYDEITLDELTKLPVVIREPGSGSLDILETELARHHIKLASLHVLIQLGSTESIKLFLENTDCLGILSIQAVKNEIADGKMKIIDVKDFDCQRMFSFVQLQGRAGGLEEKFIRYVTGQF